MDYLCLAAGKGTRFGTLGRYLQKCMYPIGLRPFLELSVRNLVRSRGLDRERDRLTLVVGHHGEQVRAYFGDSYDGLPLAYLEQPQARGTGHALALFGRERRPSEPTVVWLADLYVPSRLFDAVREHPEANVQTVAAAPDDDNPDIRVALAGERVARAWRGGGELVDIGLWKFAPNTLTAMRAESRGEIRVLPNLQRDLEEGAVIGALRAGEWLHLGGTRPSPAANVRAVAARIRELEGDDDRL